MTIVFQKNRMLMLVVAVMLVVSTLFPMAKPAEAAGQTLSYTYNNKEYKVYVPSGYKSGTPVPVVVMLHGCTQDPTQFATGTKMNTIAERETFLAVYPDQPKTAHTNKCWKWFDSAHQSRGAGDAAHIAGITAEVKKNFSVDSNKVYVAGLSAGAAMAVIMGATYPDVFASIGVGAGLEYKSATTENGAWTVMLNGGPDPVQQGTAAYKAMGTYKRVVPTVVFHGTSDYTVKEINGHQVASQWAQTNDLASDGIDNNNIDDTADETIQGQVSGGRKFTRYIYKDENSKSIVEKYIVDGMGHAWSGGDVAGSYTDPNGPNASEIMWQFFKNNPKNRDSTPPVTAATPKGGNYSSAVTVELKANESATTYYTTDGSTPTKSSNKYTAPISISTSTTLKFFSEDAAGNVEQVINTETYTISGVKDTIPPVTTASPAGGSYENSVAVDLSANEPATTYYTLDGSTPTVNSPVYRENITINLDTVLKFFSVDTAGNSEPVKTENYDITITNSSTTFTSIAAEDGFAGMYMADGLSSSVTKVGDKGMSNRDTYRSILSFDTSSLSDTATVTGAKLRVYRKTMAGSVSSLSISMIRGNWSTSSSLEQADYGATASTNGLLDFVTMSVPAENNGYTEISLPTSALEFINKNGRTQFRLKANTLADFTSDVLELYGGETPDYAPQLIVTTN
ncbi:extracellular catalytic domain type 1 short-chain-length polyhydroxyalkanoate depolymerase [Bacillus sp. FJAT-18017]|uniref:extracellular catalytic domain type 1 short-chain-length polyhydroxyalkanoate depolymerase n=1 Tax=Bacillus sp. FJAT-18017 TaxID=1705566 RepID=UPI000A4CCFD6|nr:PHB depolymerase family esterase [Bacillus sp. FJAT-18017]